MEFHLHNASMETGSMGCSCQIQPDGDVIDNFFTLRINLIQTFWLFFFDFPRGAKSCFIILTVRDHSDPQWVAFRDDWPRDLISTESTEQPVVMFSVSDLQVIKLARLVEKFWNRKQRFWKGLKNYMNKYSRNDYDEYSSKNKSASGFQA